MTNLGFPITEIKNHDFTFILAYRFRIVAWLYYYRFFFFNKNSWFQRDL